MKIYIFIGDCTADGEIEPTNIKAFGNHEDAKKAMDEYVATARQDFADWTIFSDETDLFEMGEEGYYLTNHLTASIVEQDI